MSDDESISEELEYEYDDDGEEEQSLASEKVYKPKQTIMSPIVAKPNAFKPTSKVNASVDEYSMDFSEIVHDNSYYNDRFDEESVNGRSLGSASKIRQRRSSKSLLEPLVEASNLRKQSTVPSVVNSNVTILPSAVVLPSVSVQALQAEVAIEELSKEVIKLRNQHRNILHERRTVIESKKVRADARRNKYNEELKQYEMKIQGQSFTITNLTEQNQFLTNEVSSIKASKSVLSEAIKNLEANIRELNHTNANIQNQSNKAMAEYRSALTLWENKESLWNQEKNDLTIEIAKLHIQINVDQKNSEMVEARFNKERELLPLYHQKRTDEEVERLKYLQNIVLEKEVKLKIEEDVRLASFDAMRQQLLQELQTNRTNMQYHIDEQKKQLESQVHAMEGTKTRNDMLVNSERAELAALRVNLAQQKHDLDVEKDTLTRERHDFELQLHMVQPNLLQIQQEKAEVAKLKQNSERLLNSLTDQAKALHTMEQELIQREIKCQQYMSDVASTEENFITREQMLIQKENSFSVLRKQLDKDRFVLHQCMMEMHSQVEVIKKGIKQAMQLKLTSIGGGHPVSQLENLSLGEQNELPYPSSGTFGGGKGSELNVTHVVFALEQAGNALSQLIKQHGSGSGNATTADQSDSSLVVLNAVSHQPRKSLARTNAHLQSINHQLIELNTNKHASEGAVANNSTLLQAYNNLDHGTLVEAPMGIESVINDISSNAAMLNSISMKYCNV